MSSGMAHEAEIRLPGSFVVLQGIPGDGMANTIDSFPIVMPASAEDEEDEYQHVHADDSNEERGVYYHDDAEDEQPAARATSPLTRSPRYNALLPPATTSTTTTIPELALNHVFATQPPRMGPSSVPTLASAATRILSPFDESFIVVPEEPTTTRTLTRQEERALEKWHSTCQSRIQRQRHDWLSHQSNFPQHQEDWWQSEGRLKVFSTIPRIERAEHDSEVLGMLSPGSTVVGSEIVTLDSTTLRPTTPSPSQTARNGTIQLLKLESPYEGYTVLSWNGHLFLGPGLPSFYVDPQVWMWTVTCAAGAFVREGLELTTRHVQTLPYGAFLRVTRKTVNAMGLSRLRIHAVLDGVAVEGWISEFLNPLSGQRGPIAQPIPFPVPALYRVTLPDGAVLRSDVELSSPQIGHAPMGAVLTVVGRAFSEHPMDQCIERLKLAGHGGGWVSVRLNLPSPLDELVLELVGIDGSFEPDAPGIFHLDAQHRVQQSVTAMYADRDLSSIDEGRGSSSSQSSVESTTKQNVVSRSGYVPYETRRSDDRCLICLGEERNATIVHGETGHIACCLVCARILKARGDRCPVCRLPIDSVIQQFWA